MHKPLRIHRIVVVVVISLFIASACNLSKPAPTSTVVPVINVPPPAPLPTTAPTFAGAIPVSLPATRADHAADIDSSPNAAMKKVSGGDVFVQDLYERPFNANTMDKYFPYLDIIDTQGFKDDTWGYATITMAGTDANGKLPGEYALELDLNRDGRGDWLIRASAPTSTDWSLQGVQAWKDSNGDVGGVAIMTADNAARGGTGYETQVFNQGEGDLIDGAWARTAPEDANTVEIAFKLAMLDSPKSYAMAAWAGTNIDPAMFDYDDHLTHVEAGSPNPGYEVYPLKAMAEIDNTCRLAIGFAPTGKEPGMCTTVQHQAQEPCIPRVCRPSAVGGCVPVTCP